MARVKFRSGTQEEYNNNKQNLTEGELGFTSDTGRLYFGKSGGENYLIGENLDKLNINNGNACINSDGSAVFNKTVKSKTNPTANDDLVPLGYFNNKINPIFINQGLIPNGSDLNEIDDCGFYFVKTDFNYINPPSNKGGLLIVYNDVPETFPTRLYQMFIEHDTNNLYIRHRGFDRLFSKWIGQGNTAYSTVEDTTDIDTITNPGLYFLTSSYTYKNSPWGRYSGCLFVYNDTNIIDTTTRLYQVSINSESLRIATRVKRHAYCDLQEDIWLKDTPGIYTYTITNNKIELSTLPTISFEDLIKNNDLTLDSDIHKITGGVNYIDIPHIKLNITNSIDDVLTEKGENYILVLPHSIEEILDSYNFDKSILQKENIKLEDLYLLLDYNSDKLTSMRLPAQTRKILTKKGLDEPNTLNSITSVYFEGEFNIGSIIKITDDESKFDHYDTYAFIRDLSQPNFDLYTYSGTIINGVQTPATTFSEWEITASQKDIKDISNVMLKDKFLTKTSVNLFTGDWAEGLCIQEIEKPDGTSTFLLTESQEFNSTAIIQISKYKVYTIIMDDSIRPEKDIQNNDIYYFKVATAKTKLKIGEEFSCYTYSNLSQPTQKLTFVSGNNEQFLYIQTSKNLRPKLIVTEDPIAKYQPGLNRTTYTLNDYSSNNPEGSIINNSNANQFDVLSNTINTIGKVLPSNTLFGDFEVQTEAKELNKEDSFCILRNKSLVNGNYVKGDLQGGEENDNGLINGCSAIRRVPNSERYLYIAPIKKNRKYIVLLNGHAKHELYKYIFKSSISATYCNPGKEVKSFNTHMKALVKGKTPINCFYFDTIEGSFLFSINNDPLKTQTIVNSSFDNAYLYLDVGYSGASILMYDITLWPESQNINLLTYKKLKDEVKTYSNLFDGTCHSIDFIQEDPENQDIIKLKTSDVINKPCTAKIAVKPNTYYSIFTEPFGYEPSGVDADGKVEVDRYFKIVTTSSDADNTEGTNYTISNRCVYHIKTGNEDKWLFIMISANLNPYLQVVEGGEFGPSDIVFNMDSPVCDELESSKGLSFYKWYDIDPRNTSNKVPTIVIKDGRTIYTFICDTDKSINLDRVWRWYNQKLDGTVLFDVSDTREPNRSTTPERITEITKTLWNKTDCEGPFSRIGDHDYMSGFHGNEHFSELETCSYNTETYTIPSCKILVDGELFTAGDCAIRRNCKNITLLTTTEGKYEKSFIFYAMNPIDNRGLTYKGTINIDADPSNVSINYNGREQLFDVYDVSNHSYECIKTGISFSNIFDYFNCIDEKNHIYIPQGNYSIMFSGNKDKCVKELDYSNTENNPTWKITRVTRLDPDYYGVHTTYNYATINTLSSSANYSFTDLGNMAYYGNLSIYMDNKYLKNNIKEFPIEETKKNYRSVNIIKVYKDGTNKLVKVNADNLKVGDYIYYYGALQKIEAIEFTNIEVNGISNAYNIATTRNSEEYDNILQECTMTLSLCDTSFLRNKHIEIIPGKIRIRNTWRYMGLSDYNINRSAMAGLYSVWRAYLNGVTDNYSNNFLDARTNGGEEFDKRYAGKNVDEIIFFGNKDFTIKVKSLVDKGPYYNGWVENKNSIRYKAYLDDIKEHK